MNVLRGQGALPEQRVLPGVRVEGGRGLVRRHWLRKQRAGETTGAGREERGSGRPRGEARGGAEGDKGSPGGKGWGENVEGQVEGLGVEAESREWANSQSQGEAERELGREWAEGEPSQRQ